MRYRRYAWNKKAQTEMFGLIFIVFLISIALILVAMSEINREPTKLKQNYEKSQLATNTINTLIKTRAENCKELNLGDLFVDCAKNPYNPRIICDDGKTSCEYAEVTTEYILEETLETFGKKYFLNMSTPDETVFKFSKPSGQSIDEFCPATDRKVESVPLPLHPGTLTVEMWICS